MFGMRCNVIRILTRRARTKVSIRLRRTSRASGRALEGSMGSLQDSTSASADTGRSDGAKVYGLFQGPQRLAGRHEFVGHIAREARIGDGAGDGVIIQLLGVVQLMASGHAPGMEVPDMTGVLADRANHIPLHYLHVIEVVQQLHPRRDHGGAEVWPNGGT